MNQPINKVIADIISHYDLKLENIQIEPSFFKLETDKGPKILRTWNDLDTLNSAFELRERIVSSGFRKIDRFIRTKENTGFFQYYDLWYSLTDWIDGRSPLSNSDDMAKLGTTLSEFHLAVSKLKINQEIEPWSSHFQRGLDHFEHVGVQLRDKTNKNNLDERLLNNLPAYIEKVKKSVQLAKKFEKSELKFAKEPILCHGNLQLSSFKIDENGEWWLTDIKIPVVDLAVYDVAKFIINISKQAKVDEEEILKFIDYYQQGNPLQILDKYRILTYLSYPHDIWKFLYTYYVVKVPYQEQEMEQQYLKLINQLEVEGKIYKSLYKHFKL